MDNIMKNPGLRLIRDRIFGYVSQEALELCRGVSEDCDSWLERFCVIKFLLDFGDKEVLRKVGSHPFIPGIGLHELTPVETIVPGWKKGVKKFAQKASLDDLLELKKLIDPKGPAWKWESPAHFAARYDKPRLMQLMLHTDFDINETFNGSHFMNIGPPFVLACAHGSLEIVKLMIDSSKEFGIALHGSKAFDNYGETALNIVKNKIMFGDPKKREFFNELKTLLEKEYSKYDQS